MMKFKCGVILLMFISIWGCSNNNNKSVILDASGKHPAGWVVANTGGTHPASYIASPNACKECHGNDLMGGVSKVSCFSSDRNGISCHPGGPSGHPANFADALIHGASAKAAATGANGMAYCKNCHGSDYRGAGSTNKDCIGCHRQTTPTTNAPHAPAPWFGGTYIHSNTDQSNAPACAQCHTAGQNLSTPILSSYASGAPGCFNSTLCHGNSVGHANDPRQPWQNPENHGAAAKGDPVAGDGMALCKGCHGQALTGSGTAVSCFSCHATAPHSPAPWRRSIANPTGRIHTDTNTRNAPVCAGCHINNQRLTTPVAVTGSPGCFDNSMCHGVTGHTDTTQFPIPAQPWNVPVNHGAKAKGSTAVGASGFTYCRNCHGDGSAQYPLFQGGIALTSCMNVLGCHGILNNAPHPSKPWRGTTVAGSTGHSTTDTSNDSICSICHTGGNNSTRVPQASDIHGSTGCFNATLCHGVTGHADTTVYPAPWSSPANHGAFARSDPIVGGPKGLLYCQHCHGTDFSGGSANQSCFPCHGVSAPHPAKVDWTLKAGTLSHVNAGEGNAVICATCHKASIKNLSAPYLTRFASSPAGSFSGVGSPGCYNASMCHGDVRKTIAIECTACHSIKTTVPFKSMAGATAITDAKVGAHVDHLNANVSVHSVSKDIDCAECHNVPTIPGITATHRNNNGTALVVFGSPPLLAKANSAAPVYNTSTGQCTNVYCHGAKMPGGDITGSNTAPTWNVPYLPATISSAACGTCHGFPPSSGSGHPGGITIPAGFPATPLGTTCSCHANINQQTATAATYANVFVDKTKHINGTLETPAGGAGHGGAPYDTHNADVVAAGGNTACLVCHAIGTTTSSYPALVIGNAPDCMGCHKKAAPLHTGTTAGANCSSCHGASTATGTSIGRPSTNNGTFPDNRNSHNAASAHTNAACTVCHVLGASGGSGSGINHGRGSTAGPVRDGKPDVVGPFVTGVTVTGGSKGVAPSVSCDHTFGCGHTNSTETW